MAIPWMPRELSGRLCLDHEEGNARSMYLLTTAFAGAMVSRDDGKRPAWFSRLRLTPTKVMTQDMKEHLNDIAHVVWTKVHQDVTSEPASRGPLTAPFSGTARPMTVWQAGLLDARVIWRSLFASAATKGEMSGKAAPVLFMCCCDSINQGIRKLITEIWNEAALQFTPRYNAYRTMKNRPDWFILEALEFKIFGEKYGLGIPNPQSTPATESGKRPASDLKDWFEEMYALMFAVDWLTLSMQDAEEFLDQATKRFLKRAAPRPRIAADAVAQQLQRAKDKTADSFAIMWTDDAELRAVSSLASKLMDALEGPSAPYFAATLAGRLLLAVWQGLQPMFESLAKAAYSRVSEAHAAKGLLPPLRLPERDAMSSQTQAYDRIALSYGPPSEDLLETIQALPRGVITSITKVQAVFRGYMFRTRFFCRARSVATYCKAARWPLVTPLLPHELEELEEQDARRAGGKPSRKTNKVKKAAPGKLETEIRDYQPNVSKYLGGETATSMAVTKKPGVADLGATQTTMAATSRTMQMHMTADMQTERRTAFPLPTADHRACADLFALYLYSMYRRRELTKMWHTLCGGYDRGMGAFGKMLEKNPALKPMLDSISAQLNRGHMSGYDTAFIAKQKPALDPVKRSDADMFKSRTRVQPTAAQPSATAGAIPGPDDLGPAAAAAAAATLPPTSQLRPSDAQTSDLEVGGEYLQQYLYENEGDDSQFKDISSSVVPLSTGKSRERLPPQEYILQEYFASLDLPEGETPQRPKLDVPMCKQRLKPVWLPLKAHRFSAHRTKVLSLLPKAVLDQYMEFEREFQYHACMKLLESAKDGSLNIFAPQTLVTDQPLQIETVIQLVIGYTFFCLKKERGSVAVKLMTQVLDTMGLAMRSLHPGHRTVLEAYLYDWALSVTYCFPGDIALGERAESFFQQAAERYTRLGHTFRYCKCCLRASAVLMQQNSLKEAEYYCQQALHKLNAEPTSSLLAVAYHNLAVHCMVQDRLTDGVANVRTYMSMLRQLPKLANSSMQGLDNTQWLIFKMQDLWPAYQNQAGMRGGLPAV